MSGVWQGYTPTHPGCANPLRSAPCISILSNFHLQYLTPKFQFLTSRDKAAESDIATQEQSASLWYQELCSTSSSLAMAIIPTINWPE